MEWKNMIFVSLILDECILLKIEENNENDSELKLYNI